jgi:sulfhydrogenase subunit alpha
MNEGRILSSKALDARVHRIRADVPGGACRALERAALGARDKGTSYLVGPIARLNLNRDACRDEARQAADRVQPDVADLRNPFAGMLARAIELVQACADALRIINNYVEPRSSRVEIKVRAGEGSAATEAPRGLLYHRYRINDRGLVEFAKIVPPTSQNLRRMEDDLRLLVPTIAAKPDDEIALGCERLIRSYDPCISCSVHRVKITRR